MCVSIAFSLLPRVGE